MDTDSLRVEFVEDAYLRGPSGAMCGSSGYVFRVGERRVLVEAYDSAVRTSDGRMEADRIREAAQGFVEMEVEKVGWNRLAEKLVINEAAMELVVNRLGWKPRFSSTLWG